MSKVFIQIVVDTVKKLRSCVNLRGVRHAGSKGKVEEKHGRYYTIDRLVGVL